MQLLGQIVNHYQAPDDEECDFGGLLEAVHEIPGVERIRFASPHPRHVSDRLIAAIRDLPKVCKHLHLPVQSGSTRLLGADASSLLARLVPDDRRTRARVGPGDHAIHRPHRRISRERPLRISKRRSRCVRAVGYHSIFSFKYSERPNTLASKRYADDVPEAEKTRRIVELQALQREIQLTLHEAAVGDTFDVLD